MGFTSRKRKDDYNTPKTSGANPMSRGTTDGDGASGFLLHNANRNNQW